MENLSDQELDDLTCAALWRLLPKSARQGIIKELSYEEENQVQQAISRGRDLRRKLKSDGI
jgi:hypothetical protein